MLVKIALIGFLKFSFIIFSNQITFFILIFLLGGFDSIIKLFSQTDFKKLVAYTTIIEMNLFLLVFIIFNI